MVCLTAGAFLVFFLVPGCFVLFCFFFSFVSFYLFCFLSFVLSQHDVIYGYGIWDGWMTEFSISFVLWIDRLID